MTSTPAPTLCRQRSWHVITGEYPPAPGGVSDYTRIVVNGLSRAGGEVHVWAPRVAADRASGDGDVADARAEVHLLDDRFGLRSLGRLMRALDGAGDRARILVQYVPHAFGMKAMNYPFVTALASRRRGRLWVMFHEVAMALESGQSPKHRVLAHATRGMARLLAARADRIFVSTPAWFDMLGEIGWGVRAPMRWLPIPSTMPCSVDAASVRAARASLFEAVALNPAQSPLVLGHFGTFGAHVAGMLEPLLPRLLAPSKPPRVALLMGRGATRYASTLRTAHAHLATKVFARDHLAPDEVAAYLAACDLVVQPYPDGVTSRRTSLMASLALGLPIVTNGGALTERVWSDGGVALAPSPDADAIASAAEALLADEPARARLARNAAALYRARFSAERTVETLLATAHEEDRER